MRILMVKGSSFNRAVPQYSYPLGLMYLASYLREQQPGHEIRLLDLRCHRDAYSLLEKRLRDWNPDVVAVSALTCEAESLHRTAQMARGLTDGAKVIAGGPHISACTSDVVKDDNVDVLVRGEGERAFAELISRIDSGEPLAGAPGTAVREDGDVHWEDPDEPISDLDSIPFPAWDLVDIETYARLGRAGNVKRGRYLPVFTSRGCPFHCYYCHNIFGRRFRHRSAHNVVEEIRRIHDDFGITDLEVYDDIFNLDLDRAKSICRQLIDLDMGLSISFPNGVRADRLDRELVELLAEAGTTNLAVAVETADPELQRTIGKNLDLGRVMEAITWADNAGIVTNGYFMIGFPGETAHQIRKTIEYAEATDLYFASFFIVTPYPGTPLWDQTMKSDESDSLDFRRYNYLSGYFNLGELSSEELRLLQREAYKRFYASKRWKIVRSLFRLRIDFRNAAWLWLGRMRDKAKLMAKSG